MSHIHPTAVIESGAQIADDVSIGPFCYVGPHVTIGPGSRLVGHVTILGHATLGSGNTVWPYATLGADPQDLKFRGENSKLIIGDHNAIRESVTVHLGTENGGGVTKIGDDNLLMVATHVAHDCVIGNHVVLANSVHLAGHITINDHVVVSGSTGVHHYVTLGQYAFIGGMTRIVHDVPPFMIVEGNPSTVRGVNTIGLTRHQFPEETIDRLKDAYRRLFRKGSDDGALATMAENLTKLEADYPGDECLALLVQFLRNTSIGVFGRHRESRRADDRHQSPVR